MSKEIHLHVFKTGRVRRFAYYDDLRAAACAYGLLAKSGWVLKAIKKRDVISKYYVYSEKIPSNKRGTG